ncbi:MAG: hypothetical protein A2W83_00960 [Sulfuricurvum sp. RIFCSPLOWO2_12_43_5]|nr:MAG: hypothetical protein A2W83_00960 [Sulfuricurvum sp. RIFCSPLOWO2_12_43_5]OHE08503.1 MAG: hypothetical protein A3K14_05800 [Sulfurimonas sp. RIFCSPLOWO2_12_FULL_36_74]
MEKVLIFIGVALVLLQLYIEIQVKSDAKYLSKKSPEQLIQELEDKKEMEENLTLWDSFDLNTRLFIKKRILGKIGAILLGIGIVLEIIF